MNSACQASEAVALPQILLLNTRSDSVNTSSYTSSLTFAPSSRTFQAILRGGDEPQSGWAFALGVRVKKGEREITSGERRFNRAQSLGRERLVQRNSSPTVTRKSATGGRLEFATCLTKLRKNPTWRKLYIFYCSQFIVISRPTEYSELQLGAFMIIYTTLSQAFLRQKRSTVGSLSYTFPGERFQISGLMHLVLVRVSIYMIITRIRIQPCIISTLCLCFLPSYSSLTMLGH